MSLTICVDYDGTIVDEQGAFRPGAAEGLRLLKTAGHRLILFSARCVPMDPAPALDEEVGRFFATGEVPQRVLDQWARFEEMRATLRDAGLLGLFDDIWQSPGKPPAELYLDDRFAAPDWAAVANVYGVTHERLREVGSATSLPRQPASSGPATN